MSNDIEQVLDYSFKNKELIREALTHKSFTGERRSVKHNERLEFLGDSVLGLVAAEYIYSKYPEVEEGVLSKIKSGLVSRHNLYLWASELDLGAYLALGAGEAATGGRTRESILSNAMEAVLGAVYLDGGFESVKNIINKWISTQSLTEVSSDYKSTLQEIVQKKYKSVPEYEVIQTVGPEHEKIFTVVVSSLKKELGRGRGKNKKLAEQDAAKNALENLKK
ncbi:Ribonuclease III [Elusimicrobium minutum Pei191]|uniref:Ribonuclease 3 n=1 Tax=Elusimicrobium minutum (strain Pei191) TaxID=445932 RepID=B2KC89_ELUMP|nr:ribonuclease III [Elusimicrobium minutum]ACC98216.1 Ribonuclease III [Elusimicrobium minutum Pei191]